MTNPKFHQSFSPKFRNKPPINHKKGIEVWSVLRENLNFCRSGATYHASSLHKRNLNEAQGGCETKPPSNPSNSKQKNRGSFWRFIFFSEKSFKYPNFYTAGAWKWVFLEEEIPFESHHLQVPAVIFSGEYDMIVDIFRTRGWHFFKWIPLSHWTFLSPVDNCKYKRKPLNF